MKKLAALLCMLAVSVLPLIGCAERVAGAPAGSVDYGGMSEEEAKVRRIADAAVKEEYGITDFSDYGISADLNGNLRNYTVIYSLKIQEYESKEEIVVQVSPDYEVEYVHGFYIGSYSPYLGNATEEAVRQAEEKLDEKVRGYNENSGYYLGIDYEGYLCLNCEVIVHRAPTAPAVDGNPDDITPEIDHEHLFFSERICTKD